MKWQYCVVSVRLACQNSPRDKMNELGAEGWEVFHIEHEPCYVTLYCKRPKGAF